MPEQRELSTSFPHGEHGELGSCHHHERRGELENHLHVRRGAPLYFHGMHGAQMLHGWHGDHLLQQHVGQDDDLLQPDAEQDDGQQQSAGPGGSQSLWGRQREEPGRGELRQLLRLPCPMSPDCWWN